MFVRIDPYELIIGVKYKIGDTFKGIYKSSMLWDNELLLKFHYTYMFIDIPVEEGLFSENNHYYQWVSQNPQWKVERRAVNLIVRRLLGDDYFEW